MDRWFGAESAVMYWRRAVVVKRKLSLEAKLLIYQPVYCPTLTCKS